jgi:hypothetical protein
MSVCIVVALTSRSASHQPSYCCLVGLALLQVCSRLNSDSLCNLNSWVILVVILVYLGNWKSGKTVCVFMNEMSIDGSHPTGVVCVSRSECLDEVGVYLQFISVPRRTEVHDVFGNGLLVFCDFLLSKRITGVSVIGTILEPIGDWKASTQRWVLDSILPCWRTFTFAKAK